MLDARERELVDKIQALVRRRFSGNFKVAFDYYSRKNGEPGSLNEDEIYELLKDADVGNGLTRGTWASGIMSKLDTNRDGLITFKELESLH